MGFVQMQYFLPVYGISYTILNAVYDDKDFFLIKMFELEISQNL